MQFFTNQHGRFQWPTAAELPRKTSPHSNIQFGSASHPYILVSILAYCFYSSRASHHPKWTLVGHLKLPHLSNLSCFLPPISNTPNILISPTPHFITNYLDQKHSLLVICPTPMFPVLFPSSNSWSSETLQIFIIWQMFSNSQSPAHRWAMSIRRGWGPHHAAQHAANGWRDAGLHRRGASRISAAAFGFGAATLSGLADRPDSLSWLKKLKNMYIIYGMLSFYLSIYRSIDPSIFI